MGSVVHRIIKHDSSSGGGALVQAAEDGDLTTIKSLMEAGVDVKTQDGGNALLSAAEEGHLSVVQLLIDRGIDAKGNYAREARQAAMEGGHQAIADFLAPVKPPPGAPRK